MDEKLIIKKHLQGDDGFHTFSIRIRQELVKELDALAKKTGRTRNELISRIIEFGLEHIEVAD